MKRKPNGYWTLERCKEDALKYKSRRQWYEKSGSAYYASRRKGWYDECCAHMKRQKNENNYWTLERCKEDALNYETRTEWIKSSGAGYTKARVSGWLEECCSHMTSFRKPSNYWTKERCIKDALKYYTKKDWQKNSSGAYNRARKNGWLNKCYSHIFEIQKPSNYWTKERCKEDALKYKSRNAWKTLSQSPYEKARVSGWLEECCSHMKLLVVDKKCVYMVTFDKSKNNKIGIYFGISNDFERRKGQHLSEKTSPVNIYSKKHNLEPKFKLVFDYSYPNIAAKQEIKLQKKFLNNPKYETLYNVSYAGIIIQGKRKWTKQKCHKSALKYNGRWEWQLGDTRAYSAAKRYGWLEECCSHMVRPDAAKGNGGSEVYWTKEKCIEDAVKYEFRSQWEINSGSAYSVSSKSDWHEESCSHMVRKIKPVGYWTLEKCKKDALNFKYKQEWRNNSHPSYMAARKNKWLDECSSHMISPIKPAGYWTKEKCKEDALKYKTRSEWRLKSQKPYTVARTSGWMDECCSHMISPQKPNGYWTLERCKEDALNYNIKTHWANNSSGAFYGAKRRGWLDECCSHMKKR